MEARDRAFALDEQRRLAGHNLITHLNLRKNSNIDITIQPDFNRLQGTPEPSNPSNYQEPVHPPIKPNGLQTTPKPKPKTRPDLTRYSYRIDYRDSLKRMQKKLADSRIIILSAQNYRKIMIKDEPLNSLESPYLAIHEINAAAFQLCTKRQDYKVFTISLYEIDRLLEEIYIREAILDPIKEQRLAQYTKAYKLAGITQDITYTGNRAREPLLEEDEFARLPTKYQEYRDMALKAKSNKLSSYRPYDHQIELEAGALTLDLKFHPLYRMSTEELEVVK
jgi:hypothetical protein